MKQKHLLIVEDDAPVRRLLTTTLEACGYRVTALPDGRELDTVLERCDVDVAVFDLLLPGEDGLELTRRVRARSHIGVIILSGMGETTDRVVGLEVGADDYLPKPFLPRELVARVRSLLRRMERFDPPPPPAEAFSFDGWVAVLPSRSLQAPDGSSVALTSGEFALLEALLLQANQTVSRAALLQAVAAHEASPPDERSIDVRVGRLRRKLRDDGRQPTLIKTVRGGGYVLAAKVEAV